MKKIFSTLVSTILITCLFAQNKEIETEIRKLEQMEVTAIMAKDSVTLLKLWDKDYVVNSPANVIVFPGKTTLDRPVLRNTRATFTRDVEEVIVRDAVVLAMGSETVVPAGDEQSTAQPVKRRYTNVWMRKNGEWKLIARHANVICQQAAMK